MLRPVRTSSALAPSPTRPARLAALAKLPVFFDLAGRRVVVIGGGEPVSWKAEPLAAAGAQLDLYAETPHPELLDTAGSGALALHRRAWPEADLDGAALIVADVETVEDAERLRASARRRGIPLNVIDKPDVCDFQFGTIVNRSYAAPKQTSVERTTNEAGLLPSPSRRRSRTGGSSRA